jgi:hypothetical protein
MEITALSILNTLQEGRGGILVVSYSIDFGSHETVNFMQIKVTPAEDGKCPS